MERLGAHVRCGALASRRCARALSTPPRRTRSSRAPAPPRRGRATARSSRRSAPSSPASRSRRRASRCDPDTWLPTCTVTSAETVPVAVTFAAIAPCRPSRSRSARPEPTVASRNATRRAPPQPRARRAAQRRAARSGASSRRRLGVCLDRVRSRGHGGSRCRPRATRAAGNPCDRAHAMHPLRSSASIAGDGRAWYTH